MIEGHPDRPRLDWRGREHFGGGPGPGVRVRPCRICGEGSWCFQDENGEACHRTCAEMELFEGRAMTKAPASWRDNPEMQTAMERVRNGNKD
jgi:hypothetical protein